MDLRSYIGEEEWSQLSDARQRAVAATHGAAQPGRFHPLWADWELDALCRLTPLADSDTFRLFKDGKQIPAVAYRDRRGTPPVQVLKQLWASGVSINFARLELFSNPMLALARGLEAAWRTPVRIHFFTTPPRSQGLGVHADHSDVLILQLAGEKTWDLYRTATPWRPGGPNLELALEGHRPDTVRLTAGSWLYLPYGMYHEVRNEGDAASTHVTIGFHSLTWRALLERALELARGQGSVLDETIDFSAPPPLDDADATRHMRALRPYLELALAADKYGQPLPPDAIIPHQVLDHLDGACVLTWRRDTVQLHTFADRIEMSLPYRSVPLKLRTEFSESIERMTARTHFTPGDLPHDPATALLLCKFLAHVGVVRRT